MIRQLLKLILPVVGMFFADPGITARAQEFAPIGAVWYYNQSFVFSCDRTFATIRSVGDTAIGGKHCRILVKDALQGNCGRPWVEFMYQDNQVVYFWDPEFGRFHVLYDFTKKAGESWSIPIRYFDFGKTGTDTLKYLVDSVSSVKINNHSLKVLHVRIQRITDWMPGISETTIIEKIGCPNYLFYNYMTVRHLYNDGNLIGGLRCYSDPELGHYSTGLVPDCTYTFRQTGITEQVTETGFRIFPNPTAGFFTLETESGDPFTAELIDISGKMISTREFQGTAGFDISGCDPGFYLLLIRRNGHIIRAIKLIRR